tara:strand:- start:43462 stop:44424 length:963 start_codon:yes stop_codon:yes gene_type:complete
MNKQRGISLVELMVAMLLGLLVILVASNIYISLNGTNLKLKQQTFLRQQLNNSLFLMARDMRRIFYWGKAYVFPYQGGEMVATYNGGNNYTLSITNGRNFFDVTSGQPSFYLHMRKADSSDMLTYIDSASGATAQADVIWTNTSLTTFNVKRYLVYNPFQQLYLNENTNWWRLYMTFPYDRQTNTSFTWDNGTWPLYANDSDCMLFTYDKDADGFLDIESAASNNDERMGYRWNQTTDAIDMRVGGNDFNCTPSASNFWEPVTDDAIEITDVKFDFTELSRRAGIIFSVPYHTVTVTISGRMVKDPSVSLTVTRTVPLLQ